MKKIFITIGLIFGFITCKAQTYPPLPGTHLQNNELNKFMGTWQWVSGTDTLILKLYKQELYVKPPLDYYFEQIVGWHRYVKNGVTQETSIQYAGQTYMGGHSTILGGTGNTRDPNKLYGSLDDLTKNKSCDIYLTMANSSFTQMSWKLRESRGVKSGGFQWGFTLPTELVLTRQ